MKRIDGDKIQFESRYELSKILTMIDQFKRDTLYNN